MFSGIIEEKAKVEKVLKGSRGLLFTLHSEAASGDSRIGDSIAVNGVCLTIVGIKDKTISFDVMEETLQRTNLSKISKNEFVNLERSLKMGGRISGHFVTGHVDCVGKVRDILKIRGEYVLAIEFPQDKAVYIAEKGSIAVDGVSLTVGEIEGTRLKVYLIPHTLKSTTLGARRPGDSVNIEFDMLGKYVMKEVHEEKKKGKIDEDFLKRHGFN